jgi:hypothetical protein
MDQPFIGRLSNLKTLFALHTFVRRLRGKNSCHWNFWTERKKIFECLIFSFFCIKAKEKENR